MIFSGLPCSYPLPNADPAHFPDMPHLIVADDAFPLETFMIKPYPGRFTGLMPRDEMIYNYR